MAAPPPFSFLDDLIDGAARNLKPPAWIVEELQRRLVLMLNHVLMQEAEAQARLARQAGKVVHVQWRAFTMRLRMVSVHNTHLFLKLMADVRLAIAGGTFAEFRRDFVAGYIPSRKVLSARAAEVER